MTHAGCPSRDELFAYLVGRVSGPAGESVEQHIAACRRCQEAVATLDDAQDALVGGLRRPPAGFEHEPQCQMALARAQAVVDQFHSAGGAESAPTAPAIPLALGEYQLLKRLGEGGMGVVYKARQVNLDRVVALKVLPRGRGESEHAVARFYREMKALGRVDHPNIVRAMDAREIDGQPVLVMEYVAGLNLHTVVSHLGRLPIPDACEVVRQAALGLQCAHENGMVHRDMKPSNLMLTPQGQVKVLDLGLALLQAQPSTGEVTGSGQGLGTADYVAPSK